MKIPPEYVWIVPPSLFDGYPPEVCPIALDTADASLRVICGACKESFLWAGYATSTKTFFAECVACKFLMKVPMYKGIRWDVMYPITHIRHKQVRDISDFIAAWSGLDEFSVDIEWD